MGKAIGSLCQAVPCMFPHEILGFDVDDPVGILLSIEMINASTEEAKKRSGSQNPAALDTSGREQRLHDMRHKSGTGTS